MNKIPNIGIIILAAGASRRFGSPKQLAKVGGESLLERIYKTAISTGLRTVVVLGANAKVIIDECDLKEAEVGINEDWELGMSSSIKAGIEKTLEIDPETGAVLLILADQPFVTKETLLKLIEKQRETRMAIVASKYSETIGTPALFSRGIFEELSSLKGDKGAKALINKYSQTALGVIAASEAAFDIDTEADLNQLKKSP